MGKFIQSSATTRPGDKILVEFAEEYVHQMSRMDERMKNLSELATSLDKGFRKS